MNLNKHLELNGCHATFGASQSAWLRYNDEKILSRADSLMATNLGTEIHEFAKSQIDMRIRSRSIKNLIDSLMTYIYRKYYDEKIESINDYGEKLLAAISRIPRDIFATVQSYINDGVGFCMTTEQKLVYFAPHFFGTADSLSYRDKILRIHDLKTGRHQANMDQLMLYAAWFCLEYKIKPSEMEFIELRIYQNNEVVVHRPTVEDMNQIIDRNIYCKNLVVGPTYEGGEHHEKSNR